RPTHGRRARLDAVALGPALAHHLADLLAAQLTNEPRGEQEGEDHGRERRHDRPEGDVPQDVEPAEPAVMIFQGIKELVDHAPTPVARPTVSLPKGSPRDSTSASTTRSVPIEREPFT